MKNTLVLLAFLSFLSSAMLGQAYSLYSNDSLAFQSKYLNETITLNLHIPETQPYASPSTRYPIAIVFDSQHDRTYPHIIQAFDLLTSESQNPEMLIVGVPFNVQNRRYYTSDQKLQSDTLSGMDRMDLFVFKELIPALQKGYNGSDFIAQIGHSRTAYLVSNLAFRNPGAVLLTLSLSGFFDDADLSAIEFLDFLKDASHFPKSYQYYYTAGTSLEELSYLSEYRSLNDQLKQTALPANVKAHFMELPNANHMSNYWMSVPPILVDAFSDYNVILNNWFHNKDRADGLENGVKLFEEDLLGAGEKIGTSLNPNLTHIYSLASLFAYEKEDYDAGMAFFELGLRYYPDYLLFYVEIIEWLKVLERPEKIVEYRRILHEKTLKSTQLTDAEKNEIFEYLDGL